jgi:DNA invertase Pin-like site-specific DNA recombinase
MNTTQEMVRLKKEKVLAEKQKIGAAYIRESTDEQDKGFSPENQRHAIEEYAKKNKIEISNELWFKDLETGTKADKRDDFQRMIDLAMQHKFDIILVFHTSRFARNVGEARQYKELLRDKLGINVVSVTQHFGTDWEDPSFYLNEGVNELFDGYYSKQLSFWVKHALMEKRRQGKPNGSPPLGYYKKQLSFDEEKNRPIYDKTWYVHPDESKLVKQMFEMYSTGRYSLADIACEVNKQGVKTKYNNPFTYSSLKCTLSNRAYLGYLSSPRNGYEEVKGEHPPIIDESLYKKVQDTLEEHRRKGGRPIAGTRFYLLQDLVYCYHCRHHLEGKENNPNARLLPKMYCETHLWYYPDRVKNERLLYCCKFRRENLSCNQPKVETKKIDRQAIDIMEALTLPSDIAQMVVERLKQMFQVATQSPRDLTMVEKLQNKKKKLKILWMNTDDMTEEEFSSKIKQIDENLKQYDNLGLLNNDKQLKEAECLQRTEEFLKNFRQFWKLELPDQDRRNWMKTTLKRVWVEGDIIKGIEPRDEFKPLFSLLKVFLSQAPSGTPTKNISIG